MTVAVPARGRPKASPALVRTAAILVIAATLPSSWLDRAPHGPPPATEAGTSPPARAAKYAATATAEPRPAAETPPASTAATPAASAPLTNVMPTPHSAARAPATRQAVDYRVRRGARIDLGWTGIAHGQPWPTQQLAFELACPAAGGECAAMGGAENSPFGAPVPLAAGGVPACVVSRLRKPLTGTVNAESGCGTLSLHLASAVFLAPDLARPCPLCRGDAVALDGRSDGRCDGGVDDGKPCDVHAETPLFGATSNDCQPPGRSVGELDIDLPTMTTGSVRAEARAACTMKAPGMRETCPCPGQSRSNACDSGECSAAGICQEGPFDGICSGAPHRSCRPGSEREECGAAHAGAGACKSQLRRCFTDRILAEGTCSTVAPTYVAVFCVAATRAPALNDAAGLPGPARLVLPLERSPSRD